jgi:O-antigen ligase
MKLNRNIVLGVSLAFILLNCLALTREMFFIPLLSGAFILLYLLFFRVDILIYLMAFITPFSIIIKNNQINLGLSIPSELIMIALTLLFLFRILYDIKLDRKILKHPISIVIYFYLIWLLITSITSEIPIVSFKFLASKIWFIVSSYFVVIQLIKDDVKNAIKFFNCYAVGLAIIVLITTIRHAGMVFSEDSGHWVMSPFYNDHTAYGAILAFFLPISIGFFFLPENNKWEKTGYLILSIIFIVGFYLSFSRAAWISFIIAAGVWVVLKLRIKFSWFIVGISSLFILFYFFSDDLLYKMSRNSQDSSGNFVEQVQSISNISTDASNVERINRWVAAKGMIIERPIVGWGPGTYQFVYAPFQKGKYKTIISTNFGTGGNAHSEYIGPWAETGTVGLFVILALVILILYYGIRTYIRIKDTKLRLLSLTFSLSLITYFIHGGLNNFLDTDKLSLPFWASFAVIVVLNSLYLNKNKEEIETLR